MTNDSPARPLDPSASRRRSRASVTAALVAIAVLSPGCGASSKERIQQARAEGADDAVKLPPVKPEALREFEAGMRALRLAGRKPSPDAYEKAKERLRRAVELDGKLWEGWHNLGVVYYREGNDGQAVDAFSRALEINGGYMESRLARAEASRRVGKVDDARSDYEKVIGQTADDIPLKGNATARLASLLREAKKYDDALGVIRDTLRTSGATAKIYVELGMLYMAQGRDELAQLVLAKAVELDAKEPSIYNAQALLALAHGKSQEAFDRFDHATSLAPNYVDARFNKAKVLIDAGDYARAQTELAKVVELSPDDLDAWLALGVAHRGKGEHKLAKAAWEKVVELAPVRSYIRADALYNLAILELRFLEDEKAAIAALDLYLQEAPIDHPKRQSAQDKKKELGLASGT